MARADRTGLGLALGGHVLLLALLSASLIQQNKMPDLEVPPMGVELVDEASLGDGFPSPAPLAGAVPDNLAAATPATDAVPLPSGPSAEELAAEAAKAQAVRDAAEARMEAAREAAAEKAASEKLAAAQKAAKQSRDAAAAKIALQKAQAEARAAREKADAARKAADARAAAQKAAADKAALEKAARDAANKAARDKAARDAAARAAAQKTAAANAAKAAAAKAAKDKAAREAAARAAAQKAKQGQGGSGLKDLKLDGKDSPASNPGGNTGTKTGPSAGEVTRSITISLANAVAPRFQRCAPSGFDVNQIITPIVLRINKDGSLAGVDVGTQTGINDNNRTQAAPLRDCAIKAATAAAPFTNLPKEHYSQWANWRMRLKTK